MEPEDQQRDRSICLYCGRGAVDGVKLAVEDVLPKWMLRDVFTNTGTVYQQLETTSIGRHQSQRPNAAMKTKRICQVCNNGWMAGIQATVRPFLSRMLSGQQTELTSEDQESLAAWATMTALDLQFTIPKQEQRVIPAGHPYFAELYATHSAPADLTVWVAHCGLRTREHTGLYDCAIRLPIPFIDAELAQPVHRVDVYAMTFAFDRLAVQVFAAEEALVHIYETPGFWDRYLLRVKPASDRVTWPPPLLLEKSQLDALARRFGQPDNIPPPPNTWYGPSSVHQP